MEAPWLASQLDAGRSIESIAREAGLSASTVAYWVNKHGLTSQHAERHRARGGLTREQLEPLVEEGCSIREIAAQLGVSAGTVRHWLKKHELRTRPRRYSLRGEPRPATLVRECALHGWTTYVRIGGTRYRCGRCNVESVATRRRKIKEILVREAGGCCLICGFAEYIGALALPPRRSGLESLLREPRRRDPLAPQSTGRSGEMRATVRELPRDGRGGAARSRRTCRSCGVAQLSCAVGGSSMAEHSAVNRRVVGSSPTPRVRGPLPPLAAREAGPSSLKRGSAPVRAAGSGPPRPRRPARLRSRGAAARPARARSQAPCG